MKRLGIIGLGLMGGSLGLALKVSGADYEIRGYARRSESRAKALELGAVDAACDDPSETVASCDLVVCCLPVLAIPAVLRECRSAMRPDTIVTDVGSTKLDIMQALADTMKNSPARFVGSHPICGSEMTGIEAARADLYQDSVTIVTPYPGTVAEDRERVADLWEAVGSRVIEMDPAAHDLCLARTSHLPHLTAALLSAAIGRRDGVRDLAPICGTGYKDTTRLAEGSPVIWRDILQSNRAAIIAEVRALRLETDRLLEMLDVGDFDAVEQFLVDSRAARRALISDGDE